MHRCLVVSAIVPAIVLSQGRNHIPLECLHSLVPSPCCVPESPESCLCDQNTSQSLLNMRMAGKRHSRPDVGQHARDVRGVGARCRCHAVHAASRLLRHEEHRNAPDRLSPCASRHQISDAAAQLQFRRNRSDAGRGQGILTSKA